MKKIEIFIKSKHTYSRTLFEKDKRINNFFGSIFQFLSFWIKIANLKKELKNILSNDKIQSLDKNSVKEIIELLEDEFLQNFTEINKTLFYNKIKDYILINKENIFSSSRIQNIEEELNKINFMICWICLNKLDDDLHTNTFNYDFHILCINFWLNLVDNYSPFKLD